MNKKHLILIIFFLCIYIVTDRFLISGEKWQSIPIRHFQQEILPPVNKAVNTISNELNDVSSISVTLSEEGFREAKEQIRQFRQEILELAGKQEQATGVYHMNVQLIPIGTRWKGIGK